MDYTKVNNAIQTLNDMYSYKLMVDNGNPPKMYTQEFKDDFKNIYDLCEEFSEQCMKLVNKIDESAGLENLLGDTFKTEN